MTKTQRLAKLDKFTRQYLETLLWQATDKEGEPLDREHDISDFTVAAIVASAADCAAFQADNAETLASCGDDSQNGHDFALTRNGHGAGFWDRGYGAPGDAATKASKAYGPADLYAYGGKIHLY